VTDIKVKELKSGEGGTRGNKVSYILGEKGKGEETTLKDGRTGQGGQRKITICVLRPNGGKGEGGTFCGPMIVSGGGGKVAGFFSLERGRGQEPMPEGHQERKRRNAVLRPKILKYSNKRCGRGAPESGGKGPSA